jgi:hypothetical protein
MPDINVDYLSVVLKLVVLLMVRYCPYQVRAI